MTDRSLNKDLAVFISIGFAFVLFVIGLKIYDDRTNVLQNLGTKLVSRYIKY